MKQYSNIYEYIANYPLDVQTILQQLRRDIQQMVPKAKEKIGYGIPTFTYYSNLVHFAAYEHHIGFYPGAAPIKAFEKDLGGYKTSKGTVQLPLDKPLPMDLIRKMVIAAVERNEQRKSKK